jgi:mannose-6-phosphate isomerase-like protein (cupin superfamily)
MNRAPAAAVWRDPPSRASRTSLLYFARMPPYTILRAGEAPDFTGDAPGAFLGYGRPMAAGQVGLNVRVLPPHTPHAPPGIDPATGHSHRTIEEIYLVVDGEITIKLDDDVVVLGPRDAVLIPPETVRSVRNDSDHEALLVLCSVRVEDPGAEVEWHEGFWPSE